MNLLTPIADAVTALLQAATGLPQSLSQATRAWPPVSHKLEALTALAVDVVPRGRSGDLLDRRGKRIYDYVIDVGFRQRTDGNASLNDELMQLVEGAADYLETTTLTAQTGQQAVNVGLPVDVKVGLGNGPEANPKEPSYSPEDLETKRLFQSVITLLYRVSP